MNNQDKSRISRLYGVICSIPLAAGGGTQSASIRGLSAYVADMRMFTPEIEKVLLEIRDNDPRSGDDADATLDRLEARLARRRKENWDLDGAME